MTWGDLSRPTAARHQDPPATERASRLSTEVPAATEVCVFMTGRHIGREKHHRTRAKRTINRTISPYVKNAGHRDGRRAGPDCPRERSIIPSSNWILVTLRAMGRASTEAGGSAFVDGARACRRAAVEPAGVLRGRASFPDAENLPAAPVLRRRLATGWEAGGGRNQGVTLGKPSSCTLPP